MDTARLRRMLVSAVLGALVFGSWAYAANYSFSDHRLQSALAQGAFSFFFSMVVVGLAEWVFARLTGRAFQVTLSIAIPWVTSVVGGALVHLAAHTPSIALTLLVPGTVGLVFGTLYVLNLKRVHTATRSRAAASQGAIRARGR
jgi:hypothetical protein